MDFQILFLFTLYGGMILPSQLKKKNLSTMGFLNMWNFGRWRCARMKPMLESLVHTYIIRKTSLNYCQNLCQFKVRPFWKVFGLQAIRDLIMCEVPFSPMLMLIMKTQLSLHIVVLKNVTIIENNYLHYVSIFKPWTFCYGDT